MTIELLYSIHRRWKDGQKPSEIALQEGVHRSTVYEYIKAFRDLKLPDDATPDTVRIALTTLIPGNHKPSPASAALAPYAEEIKELVTRRNDPLKPKSAWVVISTRHELGSHVSYETFKRFVRSLNLRSPEQRTTIRIELEAGLEAQVDYAKVGSHTDRLTAKRLTVYAFIGVLSCSRFPFVQFVYRQTKPSFISSIVSMFEFWGGVTKRLNLDNLKAGVIKADIWDPELNRSLADAADHYHFFVDPCRVASPTEKGKVERLVQPVRELYRQLSVLHPDENLASLSTRALVWCREIYGERPHGTTMIPPYQAFLEREKVALQPLPDTKFEVTEWGSAKVHPDQYIRFKNRFYSLPLRYVGCTVQLRQNGSMIDIFFLEKLIRSYTIPKGTRAYVEGDFPEVLVGMMDGSYSSYLIRRAESEFGAEVGTLLRQVLTVPANQTARRALGILDRLRKHKGQPYLSEVVRTAIRHRIDQPRMLDRLFEKALKAMPATFITPLSETGKQMIRDIAYYTN